MVKKTQRIDKFMLVIIGTVEYYYKNCVLFFTVHFQRIELKKWSKT